MKALRFSLRLMLLVVALLAVIFGSVSNYLELQRVRHENRILKLEKELAELKNEQHTWMWQQGRANYNRSPSQIISDIASAEKELGELRAER